MRRHRTGGRRVVCPRCERVVGSLVSAGAVRRCKFCLGLARPFTRQQAEAHEKEGRGCS